MGNAINAGVGVSIFEEALQGTGRGNRIYLKAREYFTIKIPAVAKLIMLSFDKSPKHTEAAV